MLEPAVMVVVGGIVMPLILEVYLTKVTVFDQIR